MNCLHLAPDEKFIPFAMRVFANDAHLVSRFVVFVGETGKSKFGADDAYRLVRADYVSSRDAERDLAWADCLVIHFLDPVLAKLVLRAPRRVRVVWSGWGGDYVGLFRGGQERFLSPATRSLMEQYADQENARSRRSPGLIRTVGDAFHRARHRLRLLAAAQRADLFSAPLPDELDVVRQELGPRFRAGYVQLHYGSVSGMFAVGPQQASGGDILVGNSATWTNNHVDLLRMLAARDLGSRRVIVPLNYGEPECREAIVEQGRAVLGDRFTPLTEWMSLSEYNGVVAGCSAVIMAHHRQQALGNIGAALWRGCRVYVDARSPAYGFLRRNGAELRDVRELESPGAPLDAVDERSRDRNRAALERIWGDAFVFDAPRRLRQALDALG